MPKKVKIELNPKGVRELMNSEEVQGVLETVADRLVADLGDGYSKIHFYGGTRNTFGVAPQTEEAIRDNLENNTLLKAGHRLGPIKVIKK